MVFFVAHKNRRLEGEGRGSEGSKQMMVDRKEIRTTQMWWHSTRCWFRIQNHYWQSRLRGLLNASIPKQATQGPLENKTLLWSSQASTPF